MTAQNGERAVGRFVGVHWPWLITAIVAIVGWAATVGKITVSTELMHDIHANQIADHEERLRAVESVLTDMRADVRIIRDTLETRP